MSITMNDLINISQDSTTPAARVAVVKAADEHVLDSIIQATHKNLIHPTLIDEATSIEKTLAHRLTPDQYDLIDIAEDTHAANEGVRLARTGNADALMKGHISTGTFLKPVVDRETGIRTSPLLSHVMLVDNPTVGRIIAITDGGMVTVPREEDMMPLINHAVHIMRLLGQPHPKVALLSAAETPIPRLPSAELQTTFTTNHATNDITIEGPLSLDLALLPSHAEEKGWKGRIRGDASILLAPDIVSGNAVAKSLSMFGNGTMAGLVLGAAVPIILVSRSSSAQEKYLSIALARILGDHA
ncbi:Phosphate acetyltransferase [Dermatophilus congolensis]|uniref:Phosphate acetyltransferase n=1 Tax=Dermatophilus congolensis TaxID=1863 RepID=A0AA46GZZ1_9MICO|nr:phosphate acyltransferase [Dermatophilus congolensis]STD06506.1 Phosphate acetyltransferase [Dermatophilus congolensis]